MLVFVRKSSSHFVEINDQVCINRNNTAFLSSFSDRFNICMVFIKKFEEFNDILPELILASSTFAAYT